MGHNLTSSSGLGQEVLEISRVGWGHANPNKPNPRSLTRSLKSPEKNPTRKYHGRHYRRGLALIEATPLACG